MKRREFLKYNVAGAATAYVGVASLLQWPQQAGGQTREIQLTITGGSVRMIDNTKVFMWAFESTEHKIDRPRVPGPVLEVQEGDTLNIVVTNTLAEPHAFAIPGALDMSGLPVNSGPIPPGGIIKLRFPAPDAGTYLYLDPLNAPVNRVLGLHGALVVLPKSGNTPYRIPTPAVQSLFNDLGTLSERFPGNPWGECADGMHNKRVHNELNHSGRSWVWLFNDIDPRFNALAATGEKIDPQTMEQTFLPRYFTLNGRSGFESAHATDTAPEGFEGEPALVRCLNASLAVHSPHIHGNHIYEIACSSPAGTVILQDNVIERDTWTLWTLERDHPNPNAFNDFNHYSHISDVLLPIKRPPDAAVWPPSNPREFLVLDENGELVLDDHGNPIFTMRFPMHCHIEMSQTAAGGNYPQGVMTDWAIFGPLRGT